MSDPVKHPSHYAVGRFSIQCIAITRCMTFTAGNAVKYVWRWQEKGGLEDLRKALVYLQWTREDGFDSVLPGLGEVVEALVNKHVLPFIEPGFAYEAIHFIASNNLLAAKFEIEEVIRRNELMVAELR